MGGSIRAATRAAQDAERFLLLPGDLVDVDAQDLETVLAAPTHHPSALIWRATTEDGAPGHPILFSRATYPDLLALTGDKGGRAVLGKHDTALIALPGQHARTDLDTPEDWAAWRAAQSEP